MVDQIEGGAAAPALQVAEFIGGFAPAMPSTEPLATAEPAVEAPPVEAKPEAPKAPEPETPLSKLIKQQREDRDARVRAERAHSDREARVRELEAENTALKSQDDPFKDPVGWAQRQKMTKEQQAIFGASLLYDTVPDKTPDNLRWKLFEAAQARKEQSEVAAKTAAEAKALQDRAAQAFTSFVTDLESGVKSFEAGSYPESEAWFDQDRDSYLRSLLATANNMADVAKRQGKVADLSAGTVAKVLEADLATRQARRETRRAGAQKQQTVTPKVTAPSQGAGETLSTKGLGAGTPRPPATTDEERLARAAAAAFRSR